MSKHKVLSRVGSRGSSQNRGPVMPRWGGGGFHPALAVQNLPSQHSPNQT